MMEFYFIRDDIAKGFCLVNHRNLSCKLFHHHRQDFYHSRKKNNANIAEIRNMTSSTTLYHSLEAILSVLQKPENKEVDGVEELLNIYETANDQKLKCAALGELRKYPLIVLEGLDGSGKTTVGNRFAKKIGAMKWKTPPESITQIRHLFDQHADLRTAYYSLGNYIAALEVEILLKKTPVVMDRFWHSTAAYAMAQSVQDNEETDNMPPEGNKIYNWPEDLFKPDIVLLLNVSEEVRTQRQSRRTNVTTQEELLNSSTEFRKNVIQAYKNMRSPGVIFINGDLGFGPVLGQLQNETKDLLAI
ncbi:hypothetical protein JTB14_005896 [Gonioctena quinquepunctata]|nr:hypothetical protein JTB14_005896 [Gonioctena quinquepunctata]